MRFNVILQHDEEDCGVACIAMMASYYGINRPLTQFRDMMNLSNNGTSVYDIVKVAEGIGLSATALKGNFDNFIDSIKKGEIILPCIVLVKSKIFYHFVVVTKITDKTIYYADPASGKKKSKLCEFRSIFENAVIEIKSPNTISKVKYVSNSAKIVRKCLCDNKKQYIIAVVISLLSMFVGLAISFLVANIFGYVVEYEENGGLNPSLLAGAINYKFFILLLSLFLARLVTKIIQNLIFSKAFSVVEANLLASFYKKVLSTPLDILRHRKSGDLIARFSDIRKFNAALNSILVSAITDGIFALGFGILLIIISPVLFANILVWIIVLYTVTYLFQGKLRRSNLDVLKENSKVVCDIEQSIGGIDLIKSYGIEEKKQSDILKDFDKYSSSLKKYMVNSSIYNNFVEFITEFGKYEVLCVGCLLCMNGILGVDKLILFYMYLIFFVNSISRLAFLQPKVAEAKSIFLRMEDIGETKSELLCNDGRVIDNIDDIQLVDVSFSYNSWSKIIDKLSFTINRGEKIVIEGVNGSGKSTLANLLAANYSPKEGKIIFNGIEDVSRDSIKKYLTYVNQEVYLFHDTLYNNLILGCENIDKQRFVDVCEMTGMNEIICSYTEGLGHIINAGGTDLSGGQRQIIALARALLRDSSVYIFDESTSAMDDESEKRFVHIIKEYLKDKIVVIITHNKKIAECFDKCYMLTGGKLNYVESK